MSDIGMGYGEMQVANLCKGYGIGPLHKEVIKDCSFTLEKSKLTVLIGRRAAASRRLSTCWRAMRRPTRAASSSTGKKFPAPAPTVWSCFRKPHCSRG